MPRAARRIFRIIPGALLLVFLVVALRAGWLDGPRSVLLQAAAPVTGFLRTLTRETTGAVTSFLRVGTLGRRVRVLEEENARLQSLVTKLQRIEEENAALRQELSLLPRQTFRLVTAEVVSRSTDGLTDALLVNRGTKDGVVPGLPVIIHDGVVIGKIHTAESFSSVVVLLTDPSLRVAAETLGTKATGLVRGERGLEIVMETIPRTATVTAGDRVVTSGADGVFPPYLLLGTIRQVNTDENDIYQSAQLTPTVDARRARFVSIIRK